MKNALCVGALLLATLALQTTIQPDPARESSPPRTTQAATEGPRYVPEGIGWAPAETVGVVKLQLSVNTPDLPRELREWNWGGGSCVHATCVMTLRYYGFYELAERWRSEYSGGEYAARLHRRLDAAGFRYFYTTSGDAEFVHAVLRTGRPLGVTWGGNHMVLLQRIENGKAYIIDNNEINEVIEQPADEFFREWRRWGGWAVGLDYQPPPPLPKL